jgi:hypothetical protein
MQRQLGLKFIIAPLFITLSQWFSSGLRAEGKKCRGNISLSGIRPAKGQLAILARVRGVVPIS